MIAPARGIGQEAIVITLLGVGMAVSILPSFALGVLAVPVIADLHMTRAEFGLTIAVGSGAGALSSVWLGGAADRRGGGALLVALFGLGLAALILLAIAPSVGILAIGSAVGGLCLGAAMPSTNRVVVDSLPRHRRGNATGIKQAGEMLAIVVVGLAIPTMAEGLGWRATVGLVATVPAVAVIVAIALLRPTAPADVSSPGAPDVTRYPHDLWWATAYATAMGISGGAVSPYLPLYAQEAVGASATIAGLAFGTVGIVAIPGRILWGRNAERTGAFQGRLVMLSGIALASVLAIWAASAGGVGLLFIGAAGWGASQLSFMVVLMLAVMAFATRETTGVASGIVLLGFGLGFMIGPLVFGYLADLTGDYDAGFLIVAVVLLAATTIAVAWRRNGAVVDPIRVGG